VLYVTETIRTPEYRLAVGILQGLRQDLFHDPFAYRPLPPMRTDGTLTRRLPDRIRGWVQWTPHAIVAGFAVLLTLASFSGTNARFGLVCGAALGASILLTLVRPVGAFWCSLGAATLTAALSLDGAGPWGPEAAVAHTAVLIVVALRTRPRTAWWMWVMSAAWGVAAGVILGSRYFSNQDGMLVATAFVLLVTSVISVSRTARERVAAERSVTAVERDRRTLLEERTTIARELHDVVAHHMSVVAIQAEAAPYRVENPPPELEQAFATIRENAVAALTELRRILGVVRAEDYEAPDAPQPVLADLGQLLRNVAETGLVAEKTVTGAVRPLPQGIELSAYRIIQEALSNALRHAPGSSAKVELAYVLGGLGLRIVNTAPRGPVKASPGAGHGITGMRERVAMLNGEMTAGPADDGGYEVTAFIPVPAGEPADSAAPAGPDAGESR
jgi:signal transduction histidine kinase